MATKFAITAGINDYHDPRNNLESCRDDAQTLATLLQGEFGFDEVHLLLDDEVTAPAIQARFADFAGRAGPNDRAVLFFSGHGYRAPIQGRVEEMLVLADGFFLDHALSAMTQTLPPGILSVVLDSCFSGGMDKSFSLGKIKHWQPTTVEFMNWLDHTRSADQTKYYRPFGQTDIPLPAHVARDVGITASKDFTLPSQDLPLAQQVPLNGLLVAASQSDQTSSANTPATAGLSAFTFALTQALQRVATPSSTDAVVAAATQVLIATNFSQQPSVVAPPQSPGLGTRSFLSLEPL